MYSYSCTRYYTIPDLDTSEVDAATVYVLFEYYHGSAVSLGPKLSYGSGIAGDQAWVS